MGVAHVGLVHRDPYECKVKGFRAVSSIERNVSKRRHLQGMRQDCDRMAWEDSGLPSLRTESQVESSGKCYPLTINRPGAIRSGSL